MNAPFIRDPNNEIGIAASLIYQCVRKVVKLPARLHHSGKPVQNDTTPREASAAVVMTINYQFPQRQRSSSTTTTVCFRTATALSVDVEQDTKTHEHTFSSKRTSSPCGGSAEAVMQILVWASKTSRKLARGERRTMNSSHVFIDQW